MTRQAFCHHFRCECGRQAQARTGRIYDCPCGRSRQYIRTDDGHKMIRWHLQPHSLDRCTLDVCFCGVLTVSEKRAS